MHVCYYEDVGALGSRVGPKPGETSEKLPVSGPLSNLFCVTRVHGVKDPLLYFCATYYSLHVLYVNLAYMASVSEHVLDSYSCWLPNHPRTNSSTFLNALSAGPVELALFGTVGETTCFGAVGA